MEVVFTSFVAPLIIAVVSIFLTSWIKDIQWKNYYKPRKPKRGKRKNTVLVVGTERVGKTQLVDTIFESEPEQSDTITDFFKIKNLTKSFDDKKDIDFSINDYRGQNISQLVAGVIQEQLKPHTSLRYGSINTLIVVVDIFAEEHNRELRSTQYDDFQLERIKENIEYWHEFALDVVFGFLTKGALSHVCLFINKSDKLNKSLNPELENNIKDQYSVLISELSRRAELSKSAFSVIVGSALKGTNISGKSSLTKLLAKYSQPVS